MSLDPDRRPTPPLVTAAPRRVAVVEDEFLVARRVRRLLGEIGHEVWRVWTHPGEVDLEACVAEEATVLVDLYFGGEALGGRLADALQARGVEVFLFSGASPVDLLGELMSREPIRLLHKPLRKRELYMALELPRAAAPGASPVGEPIPIRDRGFSVQLAPAAITHVEAARNNVVVYADGKRYVVPENLRSFARRLPGESFARVHKSFVVNLAFVSGYTSLRLRLATGEELPLGRTYRGVVTARLRERELGR